jgi:predicted O-methyltransferase YrrM
MDEQLWKSVDAWFGDQLTRADDALDHALAESDRAGLRPISVSRNQGKLLHIFARMVGATRILEVGTLGGYSGIWLARALPAGGRLITLEIDPRTAELARENIRQAGLSDVVEVRVGAALGSLERIASEQPPPFDLVFIDADKENNLPYFEWALQLTRPGSVIVIDNVVRRGRVLDDSDTGSDIEGVRRVVERVAHEPRVSATALQTVGEKGYDGFLIAIVNE